MCAPADIFLGLLAILFPPLPVWIKTGICSGASLLNLILLILGYLPGLLHAWYIIAAIPEGTSTAYYYEEIDTEAGHGHGQSRLPGPNAAGVSHGGPGVGAGANASAGYVAPPPQLGPATGYGTVQQAGPSTGEDVPEGLPPTYDQAIKGDNKVQK